MRLSRGQAAWGTMEILIAVIIMGFSMAIVYYMMAGVEDARCTATLKSQTTSLQNALLDVALGAPTTQRRVDYNFISCGNKRVSAVRFVYYNKPQYCTRCTAATNGCWMLQPTYQDVRTGKLYDVSDADVCVDIPADISLAIRDGKLTGAQDSPVCLGGSHFSPTPGCPSGSICAPKVGVSDTSYTNVPASVYSPDVQSSNSRWATFALVPGDSSLFRFIITKGVTPSQTGGTIEICPLDLSKTRAPS